jgi:hypothetical protein
MGAHMEQDYVIRRHHQQLLLFGCVSFCSETGSSLTVASGLPIITCETRKLGIQLIRSDHPIKIHIRANKKKNEQAYDVLFYPDICVTHAIDLKEAIYKTLFVKKKDSLELEAAEPTFVVSPKAFTELSEKNHLLLDLEFKPTDSDKEAVLSISKDTDHFSYRTVNGEEETLSKACSILIKKVSW